MSYTVQGYLIHLFYVIFLCHREDLDEGDVPPDCEVTYTLELLSVEKGPDISNLTDEERIRFGYDLNNEY